MASKLRTYRGVSIERAFPSGLWVAFIANYGLLRADTLAGLKRLISKALAE